MKNSIIYIITAIVILGGSYLIFNTKSQNQNQKNQDTQVSTQTNSQVVYASMKELVSLGKSLQCTFESNTEFAKTSGVVYVADGKVRGNFRVIVSSLGNKSFDAYMIADNSYTYVWSTLTKSGFKSPIQKEIQTQPGQEGVDYNQVLTYTCTPWQTDQTLFSPPSDVIFEVK